jgi:PhnB protein
MRAQSGNQKEMFELVIEFYKSAFGANERYRFEGGNGVVARLALGDSEFWISDESPEPGNFSPQTLNGSTYECF